MKAGQKTKAGKDKRAENKTVKKEGKELIGLYKWILVIIENSCEGGKQNLCPEEH